MLKDASRLDTLRVVKEVLRVDCLLDALELGEIAAKVVLLRRSLTQARVWVVEVPSPLAGRQTIRNVLDIVLDVGKPRRGEDALVYAIVKEVHEEVIAVGVSSRVRSFR